MLRVRGIPTVSNVFYSIQSSDVDFGGSAVDIYNVDAGADTDSGDIGAKRASHCHTVGGEMLSFYQLVTAAGDELVCVDIGHT